MPDFLLPFWWYDLAHRGPWSCAALQAPQPGTFKRLAEVLRQTQGAFAAMAPATTF
jgi:hypothetical protein